MAAPTQLSGRVWKYGDDINTDVLFPGKYTYNLPPSEFARHALEDLDPDFATSVSIGDIVIGGKNFGCGSSREQAAVCIKLSGVKVIVATSFARIFFRNCVNNGVLPITCPAAVAAAVHGGQAGIDLVGNHVRVGQVDFEFPPLSDSVKAIFDAGGLIPMLRKRLGTDHLPLPEVKFSGE